MSAFLLVILILIVMGIAAYTAVHNYHKYQERSQQAVRRGWRYTPLNWTQFIKPEFKLAGRTNTGAIWELQRVWRSGQLLLNWETHSATLPYGVVGILPAVSTTMPRTPPYKTYPLAASLSSWPDTYQLFTSHDQLASFFFTEMITRILHEYPAWPEKGAIDQLIWMKSSLYIVCLYEDDWEILERIVTLGSTLVDRVNRENRV